MTRRHRRQPARLVGLVTLGAVGVIVLQPVAAMLVPLLLFALAVAVLAEVVRR